MRLDSVHNIINKAAIEAGLSPIAASTDVYASTDANIILLRTLLETVGEEIVQEREGGWTHLQAEYTFNTVIGTASYALPAGFFMMIPQTGWDRTTRFPLSGPLSPQEWQFSKARIISSRLYLAFRPLQQKMFFDPTPTAVDTIAFEYRTSYWVAVTNSTTPTKELPTVDTDVLLFDRLLLIKALVYSYLAKKGLATSHHLDEYESALNKAKDADAAAAAQVLSLNGQRSSLRLLGPANVPDTGLGS